MKHKVKVGQVIEVRKCGEFRNPVFIKIKINKLLTAKESSLKFPEAWVEKV